MNEGASKSFAEIRTRGRENLAKKGADIGGKASGIRERLTKIFSRIKKGGVETMRRTKEITLDALAYASQPKEVVALLNERSARWRESIMQARSQDEAAELVRSMRAFVTDFPKMMDRVKKRIAIESRARTLSRAVGVVAREAHVLNEKVETLRKMIAEREDLMKEKSDELARLTERANRLAEVRARISGKERLFQNVKGNGAEPAPADALTNAA